MSEHDIFPTPSYFIQPATEECVFGSRRKVKVSVLSANFKKCRFCNFSGSYTKRSPSEKWSWAKTHSVTVTGASWVHFNPRKTKIGQKKSLTPFFHRDLQFASVIFGGYSGFRLSFQRCGLLCLFWRLICYVAR